MKRLMEIRNLLLFSMAIGVFIIAATFKTAKGGSYVKLDPYLYGQADGDVGDPYGDEYGSASFTTGTNYTQCEAYGYLWMEGEDGFARLSIIDVDSWAYLNHAWEWDGEPNETAPGGTLFYDYNFFGLLNAEGCTYADPLSYAADSSAQASGTGYGSTNPGDSNSVTAKAYGSVHLNMMGSAGVSFSPSSAENDYTISTDDGYYYSGGSWYLSIGDEEDIAEGTTYISYSLFSSCDVLILAQIITTIDNAACAGAVAGVYSLAYGNVNFTSN